MRMIVGGRRGIRCFFRRMVISSTFNRLVDFLEAVKIAANFRMLLRLAHRVQVIKHATYLFIISNVSSQRKTYPNGSTTCGRCAAKAFLQLSVCFARLYADIVVRLNR